MKQTIAAFDFDGTLTYSDSLLPFLVHCFGYWKTFWKLLFLMPSLILVPLGLLDRQVAKEKVLTSFFKGWPIEKLNAEGKRFAEYVLSRHLRPQAYQRIKWHKEQGHQLVLISASIEPYIIPWGQKSGFDEVLCSRVEEKKLRVTGKLVGSNCRGEEKVRRLKELIPDLHTRCVYAYGDSKGDRQLLAIANHPFYRRLS